MLEEGSDTESYLDADQGSPVATLTPMMTTSTTSVRGTASEPDQASTSDDTQPEKTCSLIRVIKSALG